MKTYRKMLKQALEAKRWELEEAYVVKYITDNPDKPYPEIAKHFGISLSSLLRVVKRTEGRIARRRGVKPAK